METVWFCLVAITIAGYVLLDGFDLGAGIIHLSAARTDRERRQILATIGPVWDGNEVWLLAGGGTLYFAFPRLYAAGFSGFYLALMVVLWLLILRGVSIEFRNHLTGDLWGEFWDVVFCLASALLTIFYGAALGNVVRGVPLNSDGYFFIPLWTNFQPRGTPGILDWYTVLTGIAAFLTLREHGALWVALKTSGAVQMRARRIASHTWWPLCAVVIAITVASFSVQPQLRQGFLERSWVWIFPIVAACGLIAIRICQNANVDWWAFVSSGIFIGGLLTSAVFSLYPYVLPALPDSRRSLTIQNASAPPYGLAIGLAWWIPAFILALVYSFFIYRHFRGKVQVEG